MMSVLIDADRVMTDAAYVEHRELEYVEVWFDYYPARDEIRDSYGDTMYAPEPAEVDIREVWAGEFTLAFDEYDERAARDAVMEAIG